MRRYALVLCLALLAGVAPHLVREAAAQAPGLSGTYVIDARASDDVAKAIDEIVKDMNFVKRPLARRRLTTTNQPSQRLQIAATGSEVSITTDDGQTVRTPADGKPVDWKRNDGEQFAVTTTLDGRTIKRTFRADDGERANTYTLGADGATLTMTIVLTSPQLPEPLTYKLVYRRAP